MRIIKIVGKTLDAKTDRLLIVPDISGIGELDEVEVFEMKLTFKRQIPDRTDAFESLYKDFQEYHRTMCSRSDAIVIMEPKGEIERKPQVSMGYIKLSPRQLSDDILKSQMFKDSKHEFQEIVFDYRTNIKLQLSEVSDLLMNWSSSK